MSALSESRDVVILGAGFSRALSATCPLTDELGEKVRPFISGEEKTLLPPGGFKNGRFEEWLSYLSEAQPHHTVEQSKEAELLAVRVTRLIREVLSTVQSDVLVGQPEPWFYEILSVLHVLRAQVITLNYDNFVECGVQALQLPIKSWFGAPAVCEDDILAGLPPCVDVSGSLAPQAASYPYAGEVAGVEERRNGTFSLLKLHGSLSWYWLPGGTGNSTLRRWRLPGVFGELWDPDEQLRREVLPSHDIFIVPPAALKGQHLVEPVTRELWRRAAEALTKADRIVMIGYSVPQADHSVVGMLAEGIRDRDVQIEVVNPRPEEVVERLLRLGVPRDAMSINDGAECVARWSSNEVSRLARGAAQAIRADDKLAADGEVLMFSAGPRQDRFSNCDAVDVGGSSVTLHVVPVGQQSAKPLKFEDIREPLQSASELFIETDGTVLPVIDHWVRERRSGVPMTQLHLMTSR